MKNEKNTKNITLIGMAGAGKTTLGKKIAKKLGWEFVDIDEEMISGEGRKLSEIIQQDGEKEFIRLEGEYALKLKDKKKTVISSGGSIIYSSMAMKMLKSISLIVFLDVPYHIIKQRLEKRKESNVIGMSKGLRRLYHERLKLYRKYAHIHINIENQGSDTRNIVKKIVSLV